MRTGMPLAERVGLDGDAGAVPSAAFAGERKRAAFQEGDGEVGRPLDIDIAIGAARSLRGNGSGQAGREGQCLATGEVARVHESIVSGDGAGYPLGADNTNAVYKTELWRAGSTSEWPFRS